VPGSADVPIAYPSPSAAPRTACAATTGIVILSGGEPAVRVQQIEVNRGGAVHDARRVDG
jgi:hypothetical protein